VSTEALAETDAIALKTQAHSLRRLTRGLYVLMGVLMLAALAATGLSYLLQSRVSQAQLEQAANTPVVLSAATDIEADESALAGLASQNCQAGRTVLDWINAQTSAAREALKDSANVLTAVQSLCASNGTRYQFLEGFYAAYVPAVAARQQRSYEAAMPLYRKALAAAANDTDLQTRALEGLAYSLMKTGDVKGARETIRNAARLKSDYVFTQITALKIACQSRDAAVQVQELYKSARAERELRIAASISDRGLRTIAVYDRQLLLSDPELKATCRYAGLPSA